VAVVVSEETGLISFVKRGEIKRGLDATKLRGAIAGSRQPIVDLVITKEDLIEQVRDVFRTRDMRSLPGNIGIAHCRYPTAGSAFSSAEAQPFYVNSPFGIVLGHNGNLTNSDQLKDEMFRTDLRHINTSSDSEVLVNVLAHELEKASVKLHLEPQTIFTAVANVHRRVRGAYAVAA